MLSQLRSIPLFAREILVTAIRRRSPAEIGGFLAVALASLSVAWIGGLIFEPTTGPADFPLENGRHEILQAALVAAAGLLFFIAAVRLDFEIFYFSVFATFFSGLAVLRETPRCGSPFYEGGPCLTSDAKLLIGLALAAILAGVLAWRRVPLARRVGELNFFWILPTSFSGIMLIAAEIMGSYYFEVWKEETLELASYLNLTVFAIAVHLRPEWFDSRRTGAGLSSETNASHGAESIGLEDRDSARQQGK